MARLILVLFLAFFFLISFSANPPQGRTGAPGERTCATAGCHLPESALIDGHVDIIGLPDQLIRGEVYPIRVELITDQGDPARGGLQMTALTAGEEPVELWMNPGKNSTVSETGGRFYFEHDPALNFAGDTLVYTLDLQYNGESGEDIIIYGSANFANGNGANSGDQIISFTDTLLQEVSNTLDLSAEVVQPSCASASDGVIDIMPLSGQAPYSYDWNTGDDTNPLGGLIASTYTVTVTDSNNLQDSLEIVLMASTDTIAPSIFCVADTLVISSCSPFSYPTPTADDNCEVSSISLIAGLGSNMSFPEGLSIEVYEAMDGSGNISLCSIFINNNFIIDTDVDVTNLACHDSEFGSVDIVASGSNAPFVTTLSDGSPLEENLAEAAYTAIITDDTGCTDTVSFEVRRPDSLVVDVVDIIRPINADSGDGAINIEAEGGTPPYSYTWRIEDEDFSQDEDLRLLFPGRYALQVSDSRGCLAAPDTILLETTTFVVDLDISDEVRIFPNPSPDIIYLDNVGGLNFKDVQIASITGKTLVTMPYQEGAIDISVLDAGLYILSLRTTDDKLGVLHFCKY